MSKKDKPTNRLYYISAFNELLKFSTRQIEDLLACVPGAVKAAKRDIKKYGPANMPGIFFLDDGMAEVNTKKGMKTMRKMIERGEYTTP